MALTITKLKMWKDPGYTRGCLEVPPAGSQKLPLPDYTSAADETLRPHKGSTLTVLHLPLSFTETFGMSYLYIEATDGKGSVSLFGWIDSITQRSTSAEGITLMWTVDWWRSYSGSATFGSALVTRCADGSYKRPRTLQPRYKKKASETALFPITKSTTVTSEKSGLWVMIFAVLTSGNATLITKFFFQAEPDKNPTPNVNLFTNGRATSGLPIRACYNGLIDELLSMYAETLTDTNISIVSAFVTPIPPSDGLTWDESNLYWKYSGSSAYINFNAGGGARDYGFFFDILGTNKFDNSYTKTFTTFTPDDNATYHIIDMEGNIVGTLPWGIDITGAIIENDLGPVASYLRIRFTSSILGSGDTAAGSPSGLLFSIPLPSLPITSNYWSDYVLSGQREFNRLNREYAREEEAWKAGISETKSAIDTAVSLNPMDWVDAIAGAATGFSAIGANLMVNEEFADKYNRLDDMAASRQKNTIQENGFSLNWMTHGYVNEVTDRNSYSTGPWLVKMEMDSVSAAEYSNEITTMGYEVQIPVTTLTSFITAAGPLKAHNAIVTGNIPPEAKQAIRTLLENGIRMIENNPSGVIP